MYFISQFSKIISYAYKSFIVWVGSYVIDNQSNKYVSNERSAQCKWVVQLNIMRIKTHSYQSLGLWFAQNCLFRHTKCGRKDTSGMCITDASALMHTQKFSQEFLRNSKILYLLTFFTRHIYYFCINYIVRHQALSSHHRFP